MPTLLFEMSVLERFRSVSDFQPLTDARDLRATLIEWSLNEKNIPKRKRILFLEDLKCSTNNLVKNIREAMYCFPKDEESLQIRKDYISLAIGNCRDIWDELQFIDDVQTLSNPLNLDKLEIQLTLLLKIWNELRKWRESSKVKSRDS